MLDGRAIDRAIALGVRDALIQHQRAGVPVVIWENGRAVHKSAGEVLAELDQEHKHRSQSKRAKPKRRRPMPKAA